MDWLIILGSGAGAIMAILAFGTKVLSMIKKALEPVYNLQMEMKTVKEAMLASLKYQISRGHREYMKDGKIDRYALELVIDLYDSYKDLGGNGLIENLVNELKRLPMDMRTGRDET